MIGRLIEIVRRLLAKLGLLGDGGRDQVEVDEPTGRTVEGVFTPEPGMRVKSHEEGFGLAIQNAVEQIAGFGVGEYNVKFTFEARVDVTNPGEVGQYKVFG